MLGPPDHSPTTPPRRLAERVKPRVWTVDERSANSPPGAGGPDASPTGRRLPRSSSLCSEFVAREHAGGLHRVSYDSSASGAMGGYRKKPPAISVGSSYGLSAPSPKTPGTPSLGSRAVAAARARAAQQRAWEASHSHLTPIERRKARVVTVLDSAAWTMITTVVTVYVLFAPDIRLAVTPAAADVGFVTMTVFAFVLFTAELVVQAWARPGFKYSFFFWLDALATVSLVVDMPFIMDPLIALFATLSSADPNNAITATSQTVAARAGRIAMLGAKAGRLARNIRLARVLSACARGHNRSRAAVLVSPTATMRSRAQKATSQTGRLLAEKLTQYTIVGCLAFLLGFSMLNRHELLEGDDRRLLSIQRVERLVAAHHDASVLAGLDLAGANRAGGSLHSLAEPIARSFERLRSFDGVVHLEMPGAPVAFPSASAAVLAATHRRQEVAFVRYKSKLLPGSPEIMARFDLTEDVQAAAALKSAATVVLVVLFALGAYLFSASSNK